MVAMCWGSYTHPIHYVYTVIMNFNICFYEYVVLSVRSPSTTTHLQCELYDGKCKFVHVKL